MQVHQVKKICFLILVAILFATSCARAPEATLAPTPTNTPLPTSAPKPTPTQTQIPLPTSPVPVNYLVDIQKAIIRVEGQGRYFDPKISGAQSTPGYATGFIIDPSGLAITASEAVVGADKINVWVGEDQQTAYPAKVIGVMDCVDLALIKIDGQNFDFLQWSDDPVTAGQKVYIAGYSLGTPKYESHLGTIKSTGASEATSRSAGELLHFQSSTLPGYAGGPLVNPEGKIVGINLSGKTVSDDAVGLTAKNVRSMVDQLQAGQEPINIGINGEAVMDKSSGLSGVWVYAVEKDSIAERSGVKNGDLITNLAGQDLAKDGTLDEYCKVLTGLKADQPVDIEVYRSADGMLLQGQLNGRQLSLGGASISGTPGPEIAINLNAHNSGDVYYKEEFSTDLSNWKSFLTSGDPEKVTTTIKDGKLHIQIDGRYTYFYDIFDPLKVANSKIEFTAQNLGRNNNNVSLICRYSDRGWYEFNIANNGLYWVKRYDPGLPDVDKYINIGKGGSRDINMGRATNKYAASCKGNQLTLWINDKEVGTYTDAALLSGKTGFSISSFEVLPIVVELDNYIVSVP